MRSITRSIACCNEKRLERICAVHSVSATISNAPVSPREISLKPIVAVIAIATMLVACAPSGTAPPPIVGVPASPPTAGLVAQLRGLGSAVSGNVRVIDKGDGITLLVSAINMPIGEFRVAFHENGSCSSPNGFSAGPAWAPPGRSPSTLIPVLMTLNSRDGNAESEIHVAGVHTQGENGLAGRSVILYGGRTITEIKPGVPNNAFACGVFVPVQPFLL
jgi:Cu/Zn superoxide dismutase